MTDGLDSARLAKATANAALAAMDAAYAPVAELVQEMEAAGWQGRLPGSFVAALTLSLSNAEVFLGTYRDLRESYREQTADIPSPQEAAQYTATVEEFTEQMAVAAANADSALALLGGLRDKLGKLLADTDPPRAAALADLAALEAATGRLAEHGLDTSAFDDALRALADEAETLRSGRFPETAEGETLRQATFAMIERFGAKVRELLAEARAQVESALG